MQPLHHCSTMPSPSLAETHLDIVMPCEIWSTVCTGQQHWMLWQREIICESYHPWGRGKWCRFKLWQLAWWQYNDWTVSDNWLWIWTLVLFWETIVSNHVSCHLKEVKLYFNYFPISDPTVTKLTTMYITSKQWIICIWTGSNVSHQ